MNIPFNDTGRLFALHKKELNQIFSDIGDTGWWLNGHHVKQFSELFAEFCGTKYCLPVGNGTDALELALRATIENDTAAQAEVITVANAGGYTTTACYLVGVTPVFADILPGTQLIDPDSLINCLSKRTSAIVITHLYGGVVDIDSIKLLLKGNGYAHIPIIEDCAQAHGAIINNNRVGSFGDLATFSFYPTKNLGAMGDAGAIITSDSVLFNRMKALAQYGWDTKYSVTTPYGRNSRMDEIQAGILNYLLQFLDDNNAKRVSIYNKYRNAANSNLSFLEADAYVGHIAIVQTKQRGLFIQHMTEANVSTDIHYPILDKDQVAWKNLPYRIDPVAGIPRSQNSTSTLVSLPCFPQMTDDEVNHVCLTLKSWTR